MNERKKINVRLIQTLGWSVFVKCPDSRQTDELSDSEAK